MASVSVWDENPYAYLGMEAANQISQLAANELNYKAAKQTNQANKEINLANIEANKEMLAIQQDYNSPLNQRKMLEAAGYSPAALLGASGYHSTSSALGVPQPLGMKSPHFEPVQAGHGVLRYAQAKQSAEVANQSAAEANLKKIDSDTRSEMNKANIRSLQKKGDLNEEEADFYNWRNTLNQATFNEQVAQITQDAYKKRLEADRENVALSRDQLSYDFYQKYGEKEYQKKLSFIDSQIRYVLEQAKTEEEQRNYLRSLAHKLNMDAAETDQFMRYFDDVREYRIQQEKVKGFEASEQYKFDVVNFRNQLYAELDKQMLSVQTAQVQLNQMREQYNQLLVHGRYQEAQEISSLISTWTKSIQNARSGMITDRDKARMKLETDRLDLQRERFNFDKSRTRVKTRQNTQHGFVEREHFDW